ncbi:MAG: beta-lactamase family protein [Gemmatimonadota bacterium]|nr:beta-lactamase family protein [Gemmatimonadota bacterium]
MRIPDRLMLSRACLAGALAAWPLLVAPSLLGAQPATRATRALTARFDSVRTFIRRVMEEDTVPSIAIAVAKDGKIIWEEGFGLADRERMITATPHTMYSLASISKPITATGLMKLVDRGTVQLDRPINDYLGTGKLTGLAGYAREATVRRVLSHTAGLPLHYQFFYRNGGYDRPAMDETIGRYGILVNPPGEVFEYSNLGFGVLDHVIARASGQSYADYMRTAVFLPLGMTRTSVDVAPELEPYAAQRYDSKQRPIPFYTFDHPGGSAVYASAHDLVRLGMFHLKNRLPDQRRILADSTVDLMQRLHTPDTTAGGYGLGWGITKDENGYRVIGHSGGMPGVATVLRLYPSENVAVVVLANKSDAAPFRIAEEIAAAVLPRYEATRRERRSRRPEVGTTTSFPPAELAGAWAGTLRTYDSTVTMALLFQPDGDVHVTLGNELRTLLTGVSYRNGNLVGRFAGTIPTDEQRRHQHSVLLDLRPRDSTLRGQATAQTTAEPIYYALTSYVELAKVAGRPLAEGGPGVYAGTYLYIGPRTTRRVYAEGGKLKLEGPFGPRTLLYQGNHTFVLADDPAARVVFKVEGGRAAGFTLTSGGQASDATRQGDDPAVR